MTSFQDNFPLTPIGQIECPYEEKFAVPRQPGLVTSVRGSVMINPPYHEPEAFEGLEDFSHIWLIFRFHQNLQQGWKPSVRPPRLGGNKKLGVFATRSSFRPNGFGMSVVRLETITHEKNLTKLSVSGIDIVSGTPIYDIKPYVPYSDAIPDAKSGFAQSIPETTAVSFSPNAEHWCNTHQFNHIKPQLIEILSQDPRPAYRKLQKVDEKEYGFAFSGLNIKWRAKSGGILITKIEESKF